MVLVASLAGGFDGAFGTPLAGTVFALEVQTSGALRYDALVPALAAAITGDEVARGLGLHHIDGPVLRATVRPELLAKVALAGIVFGLVGTAFVAATHACRQAAARLATWPPLRPAIGGVLVLALVGVTGSRQYLGLSLSLADRSLAGGAGVVGLAFALKLLFTSVSLGFGFQGGEVTPLFVMGAASGVTVARLLDAPVPLLAACGFAAVFAGAANIPLTCTVLAAELFGSTAVVYFAVACVFAYIVSGETGLYESQRRGDRRKLDPW
jgi:H+/Cl- antiporter ClcA